MIHIEFLLVPTLAYLNKQSRYWYLYIFFRELMQTSSCHGPMVMGGPYCVPDVIPVFIPKKDI
jgi:hypothetical protein